MALDTITIKCLTEELAKAITGARIEKVYQPEKDEIILNIKSQNGAYRLVISANASQPRIHFTDMQKENPQKAPMFCMLLRKHIQGGKIASVLQIEYERIIRIDIDSYDELGDLTRKYLYCEIMGRHSNIILTKENHIVIDSIKHIDFSLSSVRQILPGLTYITPPAQNKTPVLSKYVPSSAFDFSDVGLRSDKIIMNTISGISPLAAREAVFCVCSTIPLCGELSRKQKDKVITEVLNISDREIKPCIICEKSSGKIIDFSPFDIFQYGDTVKKTYYQTVNEMLDEFYKGRDLNERMKQKSSDLVHLLRTNIERISKKIAILQKTLKDASKRDEYKLFGDLITANIYKIKQGDASVSVVNYYDASGKEITIDLNKTLSPSANAQRYYKLYQKSKTAEIEAAKQLEQALSDLDYLESTLVLTQNSQTERDLNEIRSELSQQGYIKIKAGAKKQKNPTYQSLITI